MFVGTLALLYVQHWGIGGAWPALEDVPELVVSAFLDGARTQKSGRPNEQLRLDESPGVHPERYDRGILMLSGGHIPEVYRRLAEEVAAPGRRVLDIGCGTGGASFACAARGAKVVGIDIDAGMLEVARRKPAPEGGTVEFIQLGAAEIEDRFRPGSSTPSSPAWR